MLEQFLDENVMIAEAVSDRCRLMLFMLDVTLRQESGGGILRRASTKNQIWFGSVWFDVDCDVCILRSQLESIAWGDLLGQISSKRAVPRS